MGPGGSRGLQSRCEARRTSWVCSIRTRLRQNDRSPFSRKRGRGFFISGRTSSRAPAIERPEIARVVASRRGPLSHAPPPARPQSSGGSLPPFAIPAEALLGISSDRPKIRPLPSRLSGLPKWFLHFSVFRTIFYVYRYILCDYRDYLTSFYHEREFAWI